MFNLRVMMTSQRSRRQILELMFIREEKPVCAVYADHKNHQESSSASMKFPYSENYIFFPILFT